MKKFWSIVRHLFLAVMTAKAFNGCIEVLSGVFLLLYGREVEHEVFVLTNYEITERHFDFIRIQKIKRRGVTLTNRQMSDFLL